MIETERLILRPQTPADRAALHAMWADAETMASLGPVKSAAESDATIARHLGYGAAGLGFWVVEHRDSGAMAGFCGLKPGADATPIAGEIEIGWVIVRSLWRQGFAREAAQASLDWAWANMAARRIVAITASCNRASRALMDRLGMRHLAELDFSHPSYAADDPLSDTVVYAIDRPA